MLERAAETKFGNRFGRISFKSALIGLAIKTASLARNGTASLDDMNDHVIV